MSTKAERDELRRLLEKATPGPWHHEYIQGCHELTTGPRDDASERFSVLDRDREEDWQFIAAARNAMPDLLNELDEAKNAFDVLMRRGWHAALIDTQDGPKTGWWVDVGIRGHMTTSHGDPFTALVEADKWMTEQEKK